MQGGGRTRQLIVSWQLMAVKPGRYTIAGPAVEWGGKRFTTSAVTFEATPSTGRRTSPFMLPGGISIRLGGGLDDDDDAPPRRIAPSSRSPPRPTTCSSSAPSPTRRPR